MSRVRRAAIDEHSVLRRIGVLRCPGSGKIRRCVLRLPRDAPPRVRDLMRSRFWRAVVRVGGSQRTLSRRNPREIRARRTSDTRAAAGSAAASRERGPPGTSLLRESQLNAISPRTDPTRGRRCRSTAASNASIPRAGRARRRARRPDRARSGARRRRLRRWCPGHCSPQPVQFRFARKACDRARRKRRGK